MVGRASVPGFVNGPAIAAPRVLSRTQCERKLALATKIIDTGGKTLELETYDGQPIALNEVRRRSG
jgi:hypothetical protein